MRAQIESFLSQTYSHWELWVSDDGSTDNTLTILKQYQLRYPLQIRLYSGPRRGFAANFLSLVYAVQEANPHDYYAFADQDDIWIPEKLERALHWLQPIENEPALYCSRTRLINERGEDIGFSPLCNKGSNFLNALVQNIGSGNTMVFNYDALMLLQETRKTLNTHTIIAHDWWIYLLVTGAGGRVFYDVHPTVHYRQHQKNVIGANMTLLARLKRIRRMFQGHLKQWIDQNSEALLAIEHVLTPDNRKILQAFNVARRSHSPFRFLTIWQLGIYRQTFVGNMGLMVGLLFKKI